MHASELWESDSTKARLARVALLPLSALYALGWEAYLATYRFGFKRAAEPHRPILCIGNLVSGGSGKSPVTLHIAQVLRDLGKEVVIACSGYGAPHAEAAALAPEGPLSASEWGDEPAMVRWQLPDVPLVVGRRRVLAAQLVHESHPNAVMLMDDGFQHLPLKKQVTLILDEENPKNRWCLPAGPYREGRWNRKRADAVVPGRFRVVSDPLTFLDPLHPDASASPLDGYSLLCALGQPGRFVEAVKLAIGSAPLKQVLLPDHDRLDAGTLLGQLPAEKPVIVTSKDWVKLRERGDVGERSWLVAQHRVRLEPADEVRQWLIERLNG